MICLFPDLHISCVTFFGSQIGKPKLEDLENFSLLLIYQQHSGYYEMSTSIHLHYQSATANKQNLHTPPKYFSFPNKIAIIKEAGKSQIVNSFQQNSLPLNRKCSNYPYLQHLVLEQELEGYHSL